MYSDAVYDHFQHPRNEGEMENPDGVGEVQNNICGDSAKIFIKVEDERIVDITFKSLGCAAAISTSSMLTELVKGKKLLEALAVTEEVVANALGGLPEKKMHCSNLGAGALRLAIADYQQKRFLSKHSSSGCDGPACDTPSDSKPDGQ